MNRPMVGHEFEIEDSGNWVKEREYALEYEGQKFSVVVVSKSNNKVRLRVQSVARRKPVGFVR